MSDILKVKEGKAAIYNSSGTRIHTLYTPSQDRIVSGQISGDEVHLQGASGKNYIFSKTGSFKKSF